MAGTLEPSCVSSSPKRWVRQWPHKQILYDKSTWTELQISPQAPCDKQEALTWRSPFVAEELWKTAFSAVGELSRPFFGFVFCFSLQCTRQKFWPPEEHLTTETSYRWVLVASSALGPRPCLILLRARDSAVILPLFPLLQRWGTYSSFSPRKPALYSSQGEQVQSYTQMKSIALSSSTLWSQHRPLESHRKCLSFTADLLTSKATVLVFLKVSPFQFKRLWFSQPFLLLYSCQTLSLSFWSFIVLEIYDPKWSPPADIWQSGRHIMELSVSYWDTEQF